MTLDCTGLRYKPLDTITRLRISIVQEVHKPGTCKPPAEVCALSARPDCAGCACLPLLRAGGTDSVSLGGTHHFFAELAGKLAGTSEAGTRSVRSDRPDHRICRGCGPDLGRSQAVLGNSVEITGVPGKHRSQTRANSQSGWVIETLQSHVKPGSHQDRFDTWRRQG